MRKKISVYWPLALIVPFAVVAWVHAWQTTVQQMPLAADQLSAELARAVSYGFVGAGNSSPEAKTMPAQGSNVSSRAI
ncbi:MAG TPA: hypothetical protein VGG24_22140 [Paraburkholderia sp.]|jgi:hypothetical protein